MDSLNILNPKQLERQVKVLDGRIQELRAELDILERKKAACLLLMGAPIEPTPEAPKKNETEKKAKPTKSRAESAETPDDAENRAPVSDSILELLRENTHGLTADDIYDALRDRNAPLPRKRAVEAVYEALEKNPQLFSEQEGGIWKLTDTSDLAN